LSDSLSLLPRNDTLFADLLHVCQHIGGNSTNTYNMFVFPKCL